MSILERPICWLMGHNWIWLVRGRSQRCTECDAKRRVG